MLEAVYERIEAESTERVAAGGPGPELESPLAAMNAGVEAFLDECAEPELQRIALHDAPVRAGLGPLAGDRRGHGLGLIEATPRRGDRGR